MAEETLYEVEQGGDPDPLGLRKKLKQVKTDKPDPLGLRPKLAQQQPVQPKTEPQQPAFQIQISNPTFKSAPVKTGSREFTYTQTPEPLDIYKLEGKAKLAHESLKKEIEGNNDVKLNLVRHRSSLQKMDDQSVSVRTDMPITKSNVDVNRLGLMPKKEMPKADVISNDADLKTANEYIAYDRNNASAFLNEVEKNYPDKSKEIQKNSYLIDAFNSAANDPNGNERAAKIQQNAKAVEKGDLLYDHKNQILIKPEGFFGSLFEARSELNKISDAYDRTKLMQDNGNEAGVISELNAKMKGDPDEPKRIPQGLLGEFGHLLGGQTIKGLAAGGVAALGTTALGNPEAAGTAFQLASGAMNAVDMYKIGKQNALEQNYIRLKSEHPDMPDYDAYIQANDLAEKQAVVDAAAAGAMQYFGAKVGFGAAKQLSKGLSSGLSQIKDELGKRAFEAAGIGGIGSASQIVKNIIAQNNGIDTPTTEGALDAFKSGVLMVGGMAILGLAYNQLKPGTINKISYGLGQMSDEAINNGLNKLEQSGQLTPEQIENVRNIIKEQKTFEQLIPEDLPETDRLKIGAKIKERSLLKQQLEQVDEAFHPEIKDKIKKLNEEIIVVSKGTDKGELQQLVDKEHKSNNLKGFAAETLRNASENDLKRYFKEISEQAHDRNSEATTIATFGEEIVNKAKELYPKEEPKPSTISIIQPGEIKHPETITIKPKENNELGEPTITKVEDGDLYEYRTPDGLIAGVRTSPTEFRIDGISATEVGKGQGSKLFESLINDLREKGITTLRTESAGEGAIKMHQKAVQKGLLTEIERDGSHAVFEIKPKENAGEAAIPQEGQRPPIEESAPIGQEEIGLPREVGITHRQMDAIAQELGLPTYEKSPEKVPEWDQQAAKKLQEPDALNNLFTKLRNGELPDHVETRMMLQYMGDIAAKIEKDPYNTALQDQMLRTKDLFNIAGRLQGKGLAARKGSIPVEETLSDFLIRDRETNKAPLTEEQITVSKKEFEDMKAAKDAFEAKVASDKEVAARAKAEKVISEETKAAKKQPKKDYSNEREKIFADIKEKVRKARGDANIVIVPYAKELIAIAPDVMKLVKNYVEQGISELPELVKHVREALREDIPHITENDIHNIIAGEYNGKKPTRSQLAQQIFDLRKEASLINELEQLQNGEIPASKNKQRQRNQKIEKLRNEIKELRDEMGLNEKTETEKLSALKARYKSQISDLEKKIAAGEYGPDVKPEPIKLDKEAIDLKDKMIKVKLDREARLAKQEYENRTAMQKGKDMTADALDAVRTLQTNPDLSFFGRQGIKFLVTHPIKGPKVFWESVRQAGSQKRYDRWLFDMHNSPAWKLIEDTGLAVLDPNTLHASQREEQWRSQLIHKIPVVGQVAKASERAFTSAANMARVDWFMEGVDILHKQGKTWDNSPEEYKGWASAVNNMTGRGGLGKLEPVVGQLAIPFWSPRLIASNVNLFLNPAYYMKMPKTARIMLIKNMAQYVVTGVGFMGLANVLGADTEADPRSSDFGKIKVGNTRYDIWGGASQYIRVMSQIFSASRKTSSGIQDLGGKQVLNTGTNLVRTKLSPIWGFIVDAKLGTNVVGEEVEWKDAYKLMIPMLYNDINDAKKDSGPDAAAVAGLLSFLGIGAQTYGSDSKSGSSSGKVGKPGKTTKQKPSKNTK